MENQRKSPNNIALIETLFCLMEVGVKSAKAIRPLLIFFILFFNISCDQEYKLNNALCNQPCYTGAAITRGVGSCKDGIAVCDGNTYLGCDGETTPSEEFCDNIDNDCNGIVDDSVYDYNSGDSCGSNIGECSFGSIECVSGDMLCVGSTDPSEETCDSLDNDCNGIVDDIAISELCYDGNPNDLLYGECHAGIMQCNMGTEECINQQLPEEEGCDGLDNDCDGFIDEDLDEDDKVDIVFAIDLSGSMGSYYPKVSDAAQLFSNAFSGNENFRFAIIGVPYPDDLHPGVVMGFSDASDFQIELSLLSTTGVSFEPSWDAAYEVCNESLPLDWNSDSKKYIILFTDEMGQSYNGIEEEDVATACFNGNYVFYAFIYHSYSGFFDDIAIETGGTIYNLSSSVAMQEDLSEIFSDICP